MATKYPEQLRNIHGGGGTSIDIQDKLIACLDSSDTPPLQIHEGRLSRYEVTIKNSDKEFVTTNIPAEHVRAIAEDTRAVNAMLLAAECNGQDESPAPAKSASTVPSATLQFGKFVGKTPIQVLSENPANKDELLRSMALLEKNVDKFPRNRAVIDAIKFAVSKLESGTLGEVSSEAEKPTSMSGKKIVIYKQPIHFGRSTSSDGYRTITGIQISCQIGKNYPWQVEITSFEAPVTKSANGNMLPELSKKRGEKSLKINLTRMDWLGTAQWMEANLERFEAMQYPKLYAKSREILKQNIEAYRANK